MNWIEALYQTYNNCLNHVGVQVEDSDELLLPLSHTTQNAHIEVTIDQEANFVSARVLQKSDQKTLIPCTESSGGRSGKKPTTHPLCDKLQYLAADFLDYGGEVTSGFSKAPEEPHQDYLKLLSDWQNYFPHQKIQLVLDYAKKGHLVQDLIRHKIIPIQTNKEGHWIFLNEWDHSQAIQPEIFGVIPVTSKPQDAFIRWAVTIPSDPEPYLWQDKTAWESWNEYYKSTRDSTGLCYVTGEETTIAIQHPAKLRHAADKAKLISANDSSGFTFRGRFIDKDGLQTCGVSFDVTQKAHNALRWLLARQGSQRTGIVAWALTGQEIPDTLADTADLFEEDEFLNCDLNLKNYPLTTADTGQGVGLALKRKIEGYRADISANTSVVVLALDSATPGRMAITYYRELKFSEFLLRLEKWHTDTAWFQNFGKDKKFIGAPAPYDIAQCAYGTRLDDKLKFATFRRLLPCVIESSPIPNDLVTTCIQRASARHSLEHWEWEKALGIACSLYRKQQIQINKHHHTMSLEKDRSSRSYLYGRLLAVADLMEEATYQKGEKRSTHAARSTQIFSEQPYKTWGNIEKALTPYKRTLAANKPGLYRYFDKAILEIMELFQSSEEFMKPEKLEGEFLLAYHTQRTALKNGKDKTDPLAEQTT